MSSFIHGIFTGKRDIVKFPLDLNNPDHARAYLFSLEENGSLVFDKPIFVEDLTQEQCLDAAMICFLKLASGGPRALQ